MDYSWDELDFVSRPLKFDLIEDRCDAVMADEEEMNPEIEADDINVTDTVTVVWSLG